VPETEAHISAAVESLCLRAEWNNADRGKITTVVLRWFDRGWCVDAILRAVDLTPDGKLQRRKRDKQEPHYFLKDSLRLWFADDDSASATEPLPPPVSGMPFAKWWAINRRNERINRRRRRKPLGAEGEHAQRTAREFVRGLRRDSIAIAREKGRRREQALDSLLLDGMTVPSAEESRQLVRRTSVNRQVSSWVGRQQVIANDPAVLRALQAVLGFPDRRPPEAVQWLRNAVRAARWKAQMATIEAMIAPVTDMAPPLSREAKRILHYVDQAIEDDLPFDVMVFMLRTGIPSKNHHAPSAGQDPDSPR